MTSNTSEIILAIHNSFFTDTQDYTSDGNVALLINGKLTVALATERITRNKYDGTFETAVNEILNYANITKNDITSILLSGFGKYVDEKKENIDIVKQINTFFNNKIPVIYEPSHHKIHAWTGLLENHEKNSLVVVIDNSGSILEYGSESSDLEKARVEQTSFYYWNGTALKLIDRDHDDFSDVGYGRFYSKVSQYIGFESYHDAGKTMGLAPIFSGSLNSMPKPYNNVNGKQTTTLTHSTYDEDGIDDLIHWFNNKNISIQKRFTNNFFGSEQAKFAKWAQHSLEQSLLEKIRLLKREHNIERIILTGGVALNSVLSQSLEDNLNIPVITPPSPGDAGLSLGLLAKYYYEKNNNLDMKGYTAYLGFKISDKEKLLALDKYKDNINYEIVRDIETLAANLLYQNKVIALVTGRSEFGPRALGHRSIIANPSNAWTKDIINSGVKKREWFRPFAPSILVDKFEEYFASKYIDFDFMMKTTSVKNEKKNAIPSVLHNDYSARVQTVTRDKTPEYYSIIKNFEKLSGLPVVLNTSFNLGGMPLVENAYDAIECFLESDYIDFLILDEYVISKKVSQ
ncbi:carbamoyltransferase C-terminal domain-containing protein [Leuconostoc mesenteroides]